MATDISVSAEMPQREPLPPADTLGAVQALSADELGALIVRTESDYPLSPGRQSVLNRKAGVIASLAEPSTPQESRRQFSEVWNKANAAKIELARRILAGFGITVDLSSGLEEEQHG